MLDRDGDYTFGHNGSNWFVSNKEAVAQAIYTRLRLRADEWFLNGSAITDYDKIMGYHTQATRDVEVQRVILETHNRGVPLVREITSYSSFFDPVSRTFSVSAVVETIYGAISLSA